MAATQACLYIATSSPSNGVSASVVCSLTTSAKHLVLAKLNRLEIQEITDQGLQPVLETGVYGHIATLRALRLPGEDVDILVFTTAKYQFAAVRLVPAARSTAATTDAAAAASAVPTLATIACGDMRDRIGRPFQLGQRMDVCNVTRCVCMYMYEGVLKVLPLGGGFTEPAFNVRLEELDVQDIVFTSPKSGGAAPSSSPSIAVLFGEYVPGSAPAASPQRHVRTYELDVRGRAMKDGPFRANNLSPTTCMLIPVPAPTGGVLAVAQDEIVYVNAGVHEKCASVEPIVARSWAAIDGQRFLIADALGALHHVQLTLQSSGAVEKLDVYRIPGEIVLPSSLAYMAPGFAFVGSLHGDSQLLQLGLAGGRGARVSMSVKQTFTNIGPIVDMVAMDLDRQGQCQVITASGAHRHGSLRIIRSGIGVEEQAVVDMSGIRGMWSLRNSASSAEDSLLLVSFATETRAFSISGSELEEVEDVAGFTLSGPTLFAGNLVGPLIVQVTPAGVRVVRCEGSAVHGTPCGSWVPASLGADAATRRVTVAAIASDRVMLALTGGMVVLLRVDPTTGGLSVVGHRHMPHEVSCLHMGALRESSTTAGMDVDDECLAAAIGLWTDVSVRIVGLNAELVELHSEVLGGDVQPRSVLLLSLEGQSYLFAALGDGRVSSFRLDVTEMRRRLAGAPAVGPLVMDRKQVPVGTQPVSLSTFMSKGKLNIFAACDRPTVIFSASSKLVYSNVNIKAVTSMAPFSSAAFPECLALASENALTIGTVDDIQKLHVRTVPLNAAPRRVVHHAGARAIVVAIEDSIMNVAGELVEHASLRMFDDITFDAVATLPLDPHEVTQSLLCAKLGTDETELILVGTAYLLEDEEEPSRGRIMVLSVVGADADRRFHLLYSRDVRGGVLAMTRMGNKIAAGVNGKVSVFSWGDPTAKTRTAAPTSVSGGMPPGADLDASALQLYPECGFALSTLVVYLDSRGDFILVGDLMKSISLLRYSIADNKLEEVAADPAMNWMTAVAMIDDTAFIGAEHHYNLFTASRNVSAASDEARSRLQVTGEFHLGDMVNQFRQGSLVMLPTDDDATAKEAQRPAASEAHDEMDMLLEESSVAGATGASKRPRRAAAADEPTARSVGLSTGPRPRFIYGTVGGALGVVITLPPPLYRYLLRVQKAVSTVVASVGALSHSHWRTWSSDRHRPNVMPMGGDEPSASGFIDGDLIELLLDMDRAAQRSVVAQINAARDAGEVGAAVHPDGSTSGEAVLEELIQTVETLSRLH